MLNSGPFEYLDTTDEVAIGKVAKKHDIDTIYHLAGILSAVGEKNPTFAWHVNMDSLYNVLEVAKDRGMLAYSGRAQSRFLVLKFLGLTRRKTPL